MRTFVAVEIPEAMRTEAAGLQRSLAIACRARWQPQRNLHLTLAFLGEVEEGRVPAAGRAVARACDGLGPVTLVPSGLGLFGRPGNATLWLGVEPSPELMGLARRVRECLGKEGLDFDGRGFRPHVTLARHAALPAEGMPEVELPHAQPARRVVLYRSILGMDGATYQPIRVVGLGQGQDPAAR